jgi:iron complex outermembrane recepter protein
VRRLLAPLLACALPAGAWASDAAPLFRFFEEENRSVTALRRTAPSEGSPVAVEVVTAEQIKASGAINLWDLLRFRAGMDVIEGRSSQSSNRAVVSVRGIPRDAVSELLVLVDGRSVYSPIAGGVLWQRLPVQIQDIERIEIVRGPNSALYGSNAGLGVINIITRRPDGEPRASATALAGSHSTRLGEAAAELGGESWGGRVSGGARSQQGYPSDTDFSRASDFIHQQNGNLRAWKRSGGTTLELLTGFVREGHGRSFQNGSQSRGLNHFQTVRLDHALAPESRVEARLSRTDDEAVVDPDSNRSVLTTRYWQYEAEALHSFGWAQGRLQTTYGLGWRYDAARAGSLFGAADPLKTNRTLRGFGHQTVRVTDTVQLMGGLSHETANAGGYHKDWQVAALWSPLEDHALRASYSRSNTKPQLFHAFARHQANAFVTVQGGRDLRPSPLTSYEAGWTGHFLGRALKAEITGFYMSIQDHLNLDQTGAAFPVTMEWNNTNTVLLRGIEASTRWRFAPGRSVYANWTHETVSDQDNHALYVRTTPEDKLNLGTDLALPFALRLSGNAGLKSSYLADSISGQNQRFIPAFWRVDARLGWTARPGLELFAAGQNLAAPYRREFVDGLVVPRMFFGGATVRF